MNRYTIRYEFQNTLHNVYAVFFGSIFPVLLLHMIVRGTLGDIPKNMKDEVVTTIFIGMAMLIPLASIFLNHAAIYSNELDKKIPERLLLFGFSEKDILLNKVVANLIILTLCIFIYLGGTVPFLKILKPRFAAAVVWILGIYILAIILMALAHGIATLIGKFGPTYGVVMAIYFAMMILSGYMGIRITDLPNSVRWISDLLPTVQLGNDYIDFWLGREYNFGPLIQSMIFMSALSAVVVLVAFKVRGRKN